MGCGSSKTSSKKQKREKRLRQEDENFLSNLLNENNKNGVMDKKEQQKIDEKLYKMVLDSPNHHEDIFKGVLPDYMLDREALDHAHMLTNKRKQQLTGLVKKVEGVPKQEEEPEKQGNPPEAVENAQVSKYSKGLATATAMNKYNIKTTNEIENYNIQDMFIKISATKDENKQANTLIFFNLKEKKEGPSPERDHLSNLISLKIKPTNYILSKEMKLTDNQLGEDEIVNPKSDPNERLNFLLSKNLKSEQRKKLMEVSEFREDCTYEKLILDPSLFEKNEDDGNVQKREKVNGKGISSGTSKLIAGIKSIEYQRKRGAFNENQFNSRYTQGSKLGSGTGKEEISAISKK